LSRVSELPLAIDTSLNDVVVVNHDGVTSKISVTDLLKNDGENTLIPNSLTVTNKLFAKYPIITIYNDLTLDSTHHTILADCTLTPITITLPNIDGQIYFIKKIDSSINGVILTSTFIDGDTMAVIAQQNASIIIQCAINKWYILNSRSTGTGGDGNGILRSGITPTGNIDDTNATFITSEFFVSNTTSVYVDGYRQKRGVAYNELNNNTIQFTEALKRNSIIDMDYYLLNI